MLHPSASPTGGGDAGQLERDLASAVERGEIHVVFQPIVDLVSSRIVAAEALMRWKHSVFGPIEPLRFIDAAERSGQIVGIGRHILRTSLAQVAEWNADRSDDEQLSMHVNVSTRQLDDPSIVDDVRTALELTGVTPSLLVLEITESAALGSTTAFDALGHLKALGVTLSIDDFGTGYSSMAYLKRLPVDALKIDKSFVLGMQVDENDAIIVRSIIDLGRNLGMDVIAEGVETDELCAALKAMGCDVAQGFGISRPLPASKLGAWMLAHRAVKAEATSDSPWHGFSAATNN
jgi:EAL domain-containing protein (putative c-di-GMP-specific phosphodiesterase class I)